MQQIFESWRKYLLVERYSMQAAYEAIKPNNKKMYNLYKRHINQTWHEDIKHGYIDPEEFPEPKVPEEKINMAAAGYRNYILEIIPEDIWGPNVTNPEQKKKESDKNQGLAMMWVRKLALKDQKLAGDIIDGEISFTGQGRPYANIMPDLEIYFQNLDLMPKRNLIELESFEELHQMVEAAKEEIHARQQERQYLDAEEGTEVLKEDEYLFIAALHNKGAACELGKGTDWCTAAPGLDYFSDYYEPDDPLFFFKHYGDRYQFHYGSEQFMDHEDRSIEDTNPDLFKYLHKQLAGTEAVEKYPKLRSYHYNMISSDSDTSPEELDDMVEEYLEHADTELSTELVTWEAQILNKVAKNASASLETLKKLYNATNNNFITRNVQNNPVLGTSKEGIELAKEIFIKSHRDEYVYDRGLKLLSGFVRDGLMSKEEFHDALSKSPKAAELGFRRVAERALREHKIIMRVKNS